LRAAALSLVLVSLAAPNAATAAAPAVNITSPSSGSETSESPSFSGTGEELAGQVTLKIHAGGSPKGEVVQELSATAPGGAWSAGPAGPFINGIYTAQASQTNALSETGASQPVTFTVDTPAPKVTLNQPESPSSNTAPSFTGTASGTKPILIEIHAGATTKGALLATASAEGTGTSWASNAASPALTGGQYTAVAIQESALSGNPSGRSGAATFTITLPQPAVTPAPTPTPTLAPPLASFRWFPAIPQIGEPVSLVSTASDSTSAITGLAWALTSAAPFQSGAAVITTSFSSPGGHVVRLLVTNAYGLSSVAAETINVVGPKAVLMQPYPVVRFAGSQIHSGIRLRLLEVQQLPAGARVTVRCKGRRCPTKAVTRVVASSTQRVSALEFRMFERSLRFGVTLEILVSAPGEIGKYTRFSIRRGKLPQRLDTCLDPSGVKPIACPSS
jgi:hypothetical protein